MSYVKDYPPYLDLPKPRQSMTNGDRIRAMSDDEMAREINLMFKRDPDWQRKFLNWLKQPAKEDA